MNEKEIIEAQKVLIQAQADLIALLQACQYPRYQLTYPYLYQFWTRSSGAMDSNGVG